MELYFFGLFLAVGLDNILTPNELHHGSLGGQPRPPFSGRPSVVICCAPAESTCGCSHNSEETELRE